VLVNRTNKYVFGFQVLPTEGVVISENIEQDVPMSLGKDVEAVLGKGDADVKRLYLEYDIDKLSGNNYLSLTHAVRQATDGYQVVLRLYREAGIDGQRMGLKTVSDEDLEPIIDFLGEKGISEDKIEVRTQTSDQAFLIITR